LIAGHTQSHRLLDGTTHELQQGAVSYGTDLQIASHAGASTATGQTRCVIHFLRLLAVCWPSARDNHLLACNSAKYSPIQNFFFTHRLSKKPFLIWLLITLPHLKYVATLPCNLSLKAGFADINVSQGSVTTYARCGGIFGLLLTANLTRNLPVKKFLNRPRTGRIIVTCLWRRFSAHRVHIACWSVATPL